MSALKSNFLFFAQFLYQSVSLNRISTAYELRELELYRSTRIPSVLIS
jgi:hypothetical protein